MKNVAEAKVFRARSYFTLYRLFKNIYLKTEPTNPETAFDRPLTASSNKEDIFKLIREDLQFARKISYVFRFWTLEQRSC